MHTKTRSQVNSCIHTHTGETKGIRVKWHSVRRWWMGNSCSLHILVFFFFSLLLENQHNQLPQVTQMGWINLILVQGHESGCRKLGRGVKWRWWWDGAGKGAVVYVGDEAWKEMKPAEGGGRRGWVKHREINDDKIGSLFPVFYVTLGFRQKQEET